MRAALKLGQVSIIKATEDPVLFARWFKRRETWAAWFAFLKVLFGLPLAQFVAFYRSLVLGPA